jgi:hypothetical protein
MQSADKLALRVQAEPGTTAEQLGLLTRLLYAREATSEEIESQTKLLAELEQSLASAEPDSRVRSQQAWSALCQTLLAANEFIYVK